MAASPKAWKPPLAKTVSVLHSPSIPSDDVAGGLKPLRIRRLYGREWDHTSPTKPLIRTSNVYDVKLAAGLVPRLKCSPGSPSSGKLLVLGCKPVLEGSACARCTVTFWRGICWITTETSKKIVLRVRIHYLKGLKK